MKTSNINWNPPSDWQEIHTIDAHAEGEPLRVIIDGLPSIPGNTILERRRYAKENLDYLRTCLMWEPRGHADMYGCIITPAVSAGADFGVLFIHNEGFSTMCGHGIIAVTKVMLETGLIPMREPETVVKIDTPAGLVTATARIENQSVKSVYFHNVPSFVYALDQTIEIPGIGTVTYDLAFGGAFYAFISLECLGMPVTLRSESFRTLIDLGMRIKNTIMEQHPIEHPFEPDLSFLYGTIFIGKPESGDSHSRNVCIFAEGEVDRSPTGTGVSARIALHYARKEISLREPIIIESIIGSRFTGTALEEKKYGPYDAVIPEVEGRAFITGKHTFYIDPEDPLRHGFIMR